MLVLLTTRSLLHLFWSICLAQALAQGHELAGFGGQKTALSQCRLVPQAAGARRSPQPSPGHQVIPERELCVRLQAEAPPVSTAP